MKDHLLGKQLQSAISLAASWDTAEISITHMANVGITVETSGVVTNSGSFVPQVRIKKNANEYSGWISLTLDAPLTLNDADISTVINLNQLFPCELRLSYTKGSGVVDGTATVWLSGIEV